jgi:hypothetical protein
MWLWGGEARGAEARPPAAGAPKCLVGGRDAVQWVRVSPPHLVTDSGCTGTEPGAATGLGVLGGHEVALTSASRALATASRARIRTNTARSSG